MKASFRCSALELALMAIVVVSANASAADNVSGTANAMVIAPVNVNDTVLVDSPSALISSAMANLTIRLPGAGLSRTDDDYPHSASVTSVMVVSNGCLQNASILASCVKRMDKDGMLNGNPVSNVLLNTADDIRSARNEVSITVTYN